MENIKNNLYTKDFFKNRNKNTEYSAKEILKIIKAIVLGSNVVDLGCGVGTWAMFAKKMGALKITGIDGPWINKDLLKIENNEFIEQNLNEGFPKLNNNIDLVIWLENIEHLEPGKGEEVVEWIARKTRHILFSGAIPNQGGRGHLNEQWQSYWAKKFKENGFFSYDIIRPSIWNDNDIPFWYKQNIIFYSKDENLSEIIKINESHLKLFPILDIVHPSQWMRSKKTPGIKKSMSLLWKSIIRKL